MTDIRKMTLGQVVDFCIDYKNRQEQGGTDERGTQKVRVRPRKATQADIDAFFG